MLYRTYGSTGIEVSAIGMGGMRFADIDDEAKCVGTILKAYEGGINYFDTAPGYFGGKSEQRIGAAVKEMRSGDHPFYIATKSMARTAEDLRRELGESLERLRVDCIDFYHMWCIIQLEDFRNRLQAGVLEEMLKARDEGLIRHVCVSSHLPGEGIGTLLADHPFEGVLMGYSVMNFPYREAGVARAAELNKGVVVMNPLGGGMIPRHADRFDFVRTQPDESVVTAALRFLLSDKRISVSLVGFGDDREVEEALAATKDFSPIPEEKIQAIRGELSGALNKLCTNCNYCDRCPQDVPVVKYMDSYNQVVLGGGVNEMMGRLKWHWGVRDALETVERCTQCGLCENLCTQSLPIRERLEKIREMVAAGDP